MRESDILKFISEIQSDLRRERLYLEWWRATFPPWHDSKPRTKIARIRMERGRNRIGRPLGYPVNCKFRDTY